MWGQWTVLVEATDSGPEGIVEQDDVHRLLAAVDRRCGAGGGGALHSSDRYMLQVTTIAPGPAEALAGVLSSWADALAELRLPRWVIVRTEVLTAEELERDRRSQLRDEESVPATGAGTRPRWRTSCRRGSPPRLL